MASTSTHTFFCCENNCGAEAHVSGGRCDLHFELLIAALREAHNPTRCEFCREVFNSDHSDLLPSESGRFYSKLCKAEWLKEHDCKGFHYDEVLEAYTCSECRDCYPAATRERILLVIRKIEAMLSRDYDYNRVVLEQSLARLREQLSQLAPVCESCGKDYSVALAAHPTMCARCTFDHLHPCESHFPTREVI